MRQRIGVFNTDQHLFVDSMMVVAIDFVSPRSHISSSTLVPVEVVNLGMGHASQAGLVCCLRHIAFVLNSTFEPPMTCKIVIEICGEAFCLLGVDYFLRTLREVEFIFAGPMRRSFPQTQFLGDVCDT